MANVTLRLVKGSPLTNSEVDNNFSNLNIFKTEIGGDLGGNVFYPTVIGLQGRSVSNTAPQNSQVLSWSNSSNAWVAANAVANYGELTTKPAVNVTITGDLTGTSNVVLSNTNTNNLSINVSYGFNNLDSRFLKLDNPTTQYVTSYVNFQGNVTFGGNVTTIGANNLIISDNFIYINDGSTNTNVDLGIVGNYNDGTYAHTGIFRDASDNGTWKIFEGYLPEPDAAVNIDTDNASFRLANLAINNLTANNLTVANIIPNTNLSHNLGSSGKRFNELYLGANAIYLGTVNISSADGKLFFNDLVVGNVLPKANLVYNLGSPTQRFKDLYLSGNTINLGAASISADQQSVTVSAIDDTPIGSSIRNTGAFTSLAANVLTANAIQGITSNALVTNLNADLLDSQDGLYYTNYVNQTNKPAANIILTGNITGFANTVLGANTNIITISAEVAANTVTLGTHTIGRYIANVEAGTAIVVAGGGGEDSVATVSHADTSTLSGVQGGAGIASITVDGLGHITAVTSTTYLQTPGLNVAFTGDVTGSGNINLSNSSTNFLSIPLTVAPNSVALGTDTTGNYTDRVVAGTGISTTGTGDEANVITVGLTTTGVSASTYGNARIIPVISVDAQGRITSASNITMGADVANISLTGDVTGSANVVLTPNSTIISIATTLQPNSVTLGTDTTGNYTDRVVGGTGISVTGTADEGNVLTASLTTTGVSASTYGNATIVPVFTVDAQGRLTSASNVAIPRDVANILLTGDVSGSANVVLGPNSTTISISTTVQPNSVALGTDTTGNYTDRVVGGTGISVTGTGDEGNVLTASLTSTGVVATTYGNARIIPVVTVDAQGRITSASNVTFNADVANITLTGDVTGSANVILGPNSTAISISTTIQPNSVALGADTTGNYTDRVVGGTGISVTGTADEGNVLTASLTSTGVVATTYGNARIIPVVTVDAQGRITSASNVTMGADVANIILTGDVSGSANAILGPNSTTISISTTVQPNSVALGTDTTGNYVDRVVGGTGISVTGTADEGNVLTASLTTTGVTANTYGNATIIPVFTVDAQGRITSASNIALSAIGTSTNSQILYNSNGNVVGSSGLTYDGTSIRVNGNLESIYQNGSEGGEIFLKNAASSTSIINGVTIDIFQDRLRFFENGGTNRGFYIDITTGNTSAGTNLVSAGGGGGTTDYAALTNKPAANIILTGDVSGSANAILTSGNTVLSITTTIQPNSVALGTDTTGNYVDRVESGGNITVTGSADEGNVITISIPQAVSTTSDLQFRNLTLSGNLSLPTLANIIGSNSLTIVGNIEATSSSTGELIVQGGIGVGGNLWASGNVVASTGNVIARKFTSLANSSYFVEPAAANAVIVAGNVYTNQRIGFMNVNTTVSVVYQYYNANARSIDTVFG